MTYAEALVEVRRHLHEELLPFWLTHGLDEEQGGYLTYYDRHGNPTGESSKSLICQTRFLYAMSAAHRAGHGEGRCLERARKGYEFLVEHFWDDDEEGWFWVTDREGKPTDASKLTYGQSFAIYGLSEYAMASGDREAITWAKRTFDVMQRAAIDVRRGGYYEFLERDWSHKPSGPYGGDRKSMDVHMHLMEAFTNLYEASPSLVHHRRACEVIDVLFDRIIDPVYGTGISQFSLGWKPLRAILFKNVWGEDRDADDDEGRPLDNTSYGHNVEFGWLLGRSIDVLGLDRSAYDGRIRKLYEQCLQHGIDWQHGGVYCEGPRDGSARERNKEFWQQAEALIGMLDGVERFGGERCWQAYENIHRFVMDVVVNHEVGEWFPLFDSDNRLLRDHTSHAWKINYHTIRSMLECERRLASLVSPK